MGIGKNCFLFAKPIKGNWRLIILYVVKIGLFSLMEDTSPLRCYSLWFGKEKEVECLQTGPTTLFVQPSEIRKYGTLFKKAEKVPMCCSAKDTKIQNVFLSSSPLSQLILLFFNMLLNVLHRDTFKMRAAAHWHLRAPSHDCVHSPSPSCQLHLSTAAGPICCALEGTESQPSLAWPITLTHGRQAAPEVCSLHI